MLVYVFPVKVESLEMDESNNEKSCASLSSKVNNSKPAINLFLSCKSIKAIYDLPTSSKSCSLFSTEDLLPPDV
jgi:hypothetical protein